MKDQQVLWTKGFGYADPEKKILATEHTPYHLASLTKTFASTVLMRLVQDGKISLDDPVSKYGINLDSEGVIRVKHLLSHTSEGTPGEQYRYNGNRFGELDKVVERAAGKTFGEIFIADILFNPVRIKYPTHFSTSAGLMASVLDMAKYDITVDRHRFLKKETQQLAFIPFTSTKGEALPYGLGWFTQDYKGTRFVWHYGYWTGN